jgi:hypothetical protein
VGTHSRKRCPGALGRGCVAAAAGLALFCAWPSPSPADEWPPAADPLRSKFSGAIGEFKVSFSVEPLKVEVEEPVLVTVRITVPDQKQRELDTKKRELEANKKGLEANRLKVVMPDGGKLAALFFEKSTTDNFYLEHVREQDSRGTDPLSWTFVYRLRPKSVAATEIAGAFVYYTPLGERYKQTRPDPVNLEVVARARARLPPELARALAHPDRFYEVATGEGVLRRSGHSGDFSPLLLGGLVLGPPGVCAVWYFLWRRLHPGAAWRVRRRRSRAAREALAALAALGRADADARTASVLAGYLRRRLELPGAEPTPAEVAAHLGRAGISEPVSVRVTEFFRACDAVRFAAGAPLPAAPPAADARSLVNALEAELCAARAC